MRKLTDKKIHEWKFGVTPANKEVIVPVSLVEQYAEVEDKTVTVYKFEATIEHDNIEKTFKHEDINELRNLVSAALEKIYKVEWSTFLKLEFKGERAGRPLGDRRSKTPWNPDLSEAPIRFDMQLDYEVVSIAEYDGNFYERELGEGRRRTTILTKEKFEGVKGGLGSWQDETVVYIPYSDERLESVRELMRRLESLSAGLHDLLKPGATMNTLTLELWSHLSL